MKMEVSLKDLGAIDTPVSVENARQLTRDTLARVSLSHNRYRSAFRFFDHKKDPELRMLYSYGTEIQFVRFIFPKSPESYTYRGLVLPHLRLPQLRAVSGLVDEVLNHYDAETYHDMGYEDYDDFQDKTAVDVGDGFLALDEEQADEIVERKEVKMVKSQVLPVIFSELVHYYSTINGITLPGKVVLYGVDHPLPEVSHTDSRGYYDYDKEMSIALNTSELSTGHSTKPNRSNDWMETAVHEWIHHLISVLDQEEKLYDPTDSTNKLTHTPLFYRLERKLGIPKEGVKALFSTTPKPTTLSAR